MYFTDLTLATSTTLQAFSISDITDPVAVLNAFGPIALVGLLLVVFIESGVLFPVLPGDSLLFVAGLLTAAGTGAAVGEATYTGSAMSLPVLLIGVPIAAILGSQVGYFIGRFGGEKLFKPDARFLKTKYLDESHEFFEKYGPATLVLARFVPFVRTFAPVAAGAAHMNYVKFVIWNAIGAIIWGDGILLLGVWLGQIDWVRDNIDKIFIGIVLVSVLPIVWGVAKKYLSDRRANSSASA
ncbi:SNARE associated Golgi protein-related protein OS=Tsukamurella paurometabola (strain ATCC 8368 / DSM / CCUG 35730 / CIP 100753 / JCM 10117 / KCTC 9821 /NBRC 16120 / NCIMB 702349 / NCTC 13040) OX=521096 GN=Tpau_0509 PE=3 SV=1 [Tsukamurella paurometabola]|uniref:SNARE associated Golgi protein-related protein n=1 Tax=Tsukamurella paurometabola (strain ATCC 8368 / DSM 20162 / CCUG 35730 / CIP 100753 / JCM 10117 / KCTC 9821 / NBRC 16120 / NCIMB 702349 / NCTC 13040) TaxID=521096 RepID=D5US83_TSUPD|nr:SNARE associated Golgi protein-related protein [Tsukamurella paurometabola DSM 20162]SUP42958.1 SNARE associated Golgi protein [Tsukamurella paurometabola]